MTDKQDKINLVDDENALTIDELRTLKNIVRWWSAGKLSAFVITAIVSIGFTVAPIWQFIREHWK